VPANERVPRESINGAAPRPGLRRPLGHQLNPGTRGQPALDYFNAFEQSFNRFPGFSYEVQGVYQEMVEGRIKFHTYVVRE